MSSQTDSQKERLIFDNGGHNSLGWARLISRFGKCETIKLTRDTSFYGKTPQENITEGFIFTEENCPEQEILRYISKTHFKIVRESSQSCYNYNPAFLQVLRKTICVGDKRITAGNECILKTGDMIKLSPDKLLFQFIDDREFLHTKGFPSKLLLKYYVAERIGKGGQSTVSKIYEYKSGGKFALKTISRIRFDEETEYQYSKRIQHVKAEIDILRQLKHLNVIQFITHYQNSSDFLIITEYAENGDLCQHIRKSGYLPEDEAKFCLYQVCKGVQHIHSVGIVHRDLKPENVFIQSKSEDSYQWIYKIGDFGYSKRIEDHPSTQLGTRPYRPPEIQDLTFNREYSISADIWPLGCTFFTVLSGSFPFHNHYGSSTQDQISHGSLSFDHQFVWTDVSPQAKALIARMIQVKPEDRPRIDEILKDDWFKDDKLEERVKSLYQNNRRNHRIRSLSRSMKTLQVSKKQRRN